VNFSASFSEELKSDVEPGTAVGVSPEQEATIFSFFEMNTCRYVALSWRLGIILIRDLH
jgi:hypothetical protein